MNAVDAAVLENGKLAPDLAEALVALVADMPAAPKDASNPHFKQRYASLQSIWDAVRPVLKKHGFALVQRTEPSIEGVVLETILMHKSGNFLSARLLMPVAQKGNPQAIGSALTYARRYSMSALLSLVTEDDDDGNAASPRPNGQPAQAASHRTPAPDPHTTRKPMPGAAPPPAPSESQVWFGIIDTIKEKTGTSSSGKPWTLWTLHGADGTRFGTFDRKWKEAAEFCLGSIVKITWTVGEKGGKKVFSVESADGDEATAVPPSDEEEETPF